MQDLHGGRKEQEVLSHLTRYADAQTQGFLAAAKKIDSLLPQLEALSNEVQEADKEYQYQRREREEKRRLLEKTSLAYVEPEPVAVNFPPPASTASNGGGYQSHSDSELGRADSTGSQWRGSNSAAPGTSGSVSVAELSRSPGSLTQATATAATQNAKFKGIRDLEERDYGQMTSVGRAASQRKEGLLWALSRPGSHVDPRTQLKAGWHK
jgi:Arf-GAP/SH3 domain/ANK repeat/PH domain-containing protein